MLLLYAHQRYHMEITEQAANDAWQTAFDEAASRFSVSLKELHQTNPRPETQVLAPAINLLATELWNRCFSMTEVTSALNDAAADLPRYAADPRGSTFTLFYALTTWQDGLNVTLADLYRAPYAITMMFDFLWHRRSSVALASGMSGAEALGRIERLLEKQRKPISDRGPEYITFDDPIWSDIFGPSWLSMGIYDQGRFWLEQGAAGRTLRYDLRSLHTMIFCLFGFLMSFLFGLATGGLILALKLGFGAFAWLYGMNSLLAWVRGSIAIEGAVRSA